jgi:hypothetical protein
MGKLSHRQAIIVYSLDIYNVTQITWQRIENSWLILKGKRSKKGRVRLAANIRERREVTCATPLKIAVSN